MATTEGELVEHTAARLPASGAAVLGQDNNCLDSSIHGIQLPSVLDLVQMNYTSAARRVDICIPPVLADEAMRMAEENLHPAWTKFRKRGKHFVVSTDSLEDLSELADFARVELEEPAAPLSKLRRAACQALLDRTNRHAVLEPLGDIHCLAVAWRDTPLPGGKHAARLVRQLREQNSTKHFLLSRGSRTTALTAGREENGR